MLLVACGKEAEYAKVIPADVELVATFDSQRILNESGFLNTEGNESQKQFIESLKKNLSAGETELFEQILANPSEVGVDWTQNFYAFVQENTEISALVLPVIDAEKLQNSFLAFLGSKIKGRKFIDEEGYAWAAGRHYYIAVNDKVCILLTTDGKQNAETLKQQVAAWISQDKSKSFVATKYHEMLLDLDGEIAVYASMKMLPENVSLMASMAYSEEMDISSIKYLSDVSFEKGKAVAKGRILYEDDKMKQWIKSQGDVCKILDANSLSYLPKNTPLWFGVGVDGNDLYDRLLEHPTYGKQLQSMSLPLDIEGVIRSIDGDLSLAYPNGFFVDVKNDQILRICVGAITTMGRFIGFDLKEVEKNQYELVDERHSVSRLLNFDAQLNMGMKDDSFYLMTKTGGMQKLPEEESLASAPWAKDVDNNLLFFVFNIREGSQLVDKYSNSRKKSKAVQDYFDYVTYSQTDIETNTIVLSFIDQQRNVLEQLLELYVQKF